MASDLQPGGKQAFLVLDRDRAHAEVRGEFYLRERGGRLKRLGFRSDAEVDLDRLDRRDRDRDDRH